VIDIAEKNEFKSGALKVLVLAELAKGENYGWGIAEAIKASGGGDFTLRVESLYPVLHALEIDGALESRWVEADNGRPRKLYSLTAKGRRLKDRLVGDYLKTAEATLRVIGSSLAGEG
jgi:PadR family transcriptional regulator PadR